VLGAASGWTIRRGAEYGGSVATGLGLGLTASQTLDRLALDDGRGCVSPSDRNSHNALRAAVPKHRWNWRTPSLWCCKALLALG